MKITATARVSKAHIGFFKSILIILNDSTSKNMIYNVNKYHKYPIVLFSFPGEINIRKKLLTEKSLDACEKPAKQYLIPYNIIPSTTYGTSSRNVFFRMNF